MVTFGGGWGNLGSAGVRGWGGGFWGGDVSPEAASVSITANPSFTGSSAPHRSVFTASYTYIDKSPEITPSATGFAVSENNGATISSPFPNTDIIPSQGTQIRWFLGGKHLIQFDNQSTIGPFNVTIGQFEFDDSPFAVSLTKQIDTLDVVGSTLEFAIKVSDGVQFSPVVTSSAITLTGSAPLASDVNVDGIVNNPLAPGSDSFGSAVFVSDAFRPGSADPTELFLENTPGFYWTFVDPDNFPPFASTDPPDAGDVHKGNPNIQVAWEIKVGTTPSADPDTFLANLWDSGTRIGSASAVRYGHDSSGSLIIDGSGDPVATTLVRDGSTTYYWQVRVTDGDTDSGDFVFGPWSTGSFKLNRMPSVSALKVEGLPSTEFVTPISGTDLPDLSWTFIDPDGSTQDKIEIRVDSTDDDLGTDDFAVQDPFAVVVATDSPLLNTGKIEQTSAVYAYDGIQPFSHVTVYWQMRAKDGSNFSDWKVGTFQVSIKPEVRNMLVNGIPNPQRLIPNKVEKSNDVFIPRFEWTFFDRDKNDDGAGGTEADDQINFSIEVAEDLAFSSIIWGATGASFVPDIGNQQAVNFDFDSTSSKTLTDSDRGSSFYWRMFVQDDSGVSGFNVSLGATGLFQYNRVPITSAETITPSPAYPKSVLFAGYKYTDLDSDAEVFSDSVTHLRWFKKGENDNDFTLQPEFNNSKFVPLASDLAKTNRPKLTQNDTWRYNIAPYDGFEFGDTTTSAELTISNHAPVASNVRIIPSQPKTHDILIAEYVFFDEDGDLEGDSIITWFKNGEEVVELKNSRTVFPDKLVPDDEWSFSVKPRDGFEFGEEVTSDTAVIEALVPVITSLLVDHQTNPVNIVNLNPTFSWAFFDLSGLGQKGFRLKIGTQKELGDVFDTGFVDSSNTEFSYDGPPLNVGSQFFATLTLSNNQGISDPFIAEFTTFGSIWGEQVDNETGWTISARFRFIPEITSEEEAAAAAAAPLPEPPSSSPVPPAELGGDPFPHPSV